MVCSGDQVRLNCGCGGYHLIGWVNIDANPKVAADRHLELPPIPYDDGSVTEIFAGHMLEHLTRNDAAEFLRECYRVLEPGGKLCLVTPDTHEIMRRWIEGDLGLMQFPHNVWWKIDNLETINRLFLYSSVQDSPHLWAWDADTLTTVMTIAGFEGLHEIDRYDDTRLGSGAWYQVGIEGVKPCAS